VASDAPRPAGLARDVAWLDLNAPEQVLTWVSRRVAAES
jgi:hypothetical protein